MKSSQSSTLQNIHIGATRSKSEKNYPHIDTDNQTLAKVLMT